MASFDAAAWVPGKCEYGLLHLLICREVLLKALSTAPPVNRLKALEARLCSPVLQPTHREAPPPLPDAEVDDFDDDASYISEGEPFEQTELVAWGKGHRRAWWRVRPAIREDVVLRSGVSMASAEMRRALPGETLQQKGKPRVLLEGRAQGCIRMPVQPCGWVTADASRAPRWKVVYQSPSPSFSTGDVVVRASEELNSEAVSSLFINDVVEQAGPMIPRADGIIRMSILTTGSTRICGWVTVDASAAGGPVLFKLISESDSMAPSTTGYRSPAKGHGRGGPRKKEGVERNDQDVGLKPTGIGREMRN